MPFASTCMRSNGRIVWVPWWLKGFPQIMFVWYVLIVWPDRQFENNMLHEKYKRDCKLKYAMTLAFMHGKSTNKLPFSSIIDSSWLQPQTILLLVVYKKTIHIPKQLSSWYQKDHFSNCGLCYFDLNFWSDTDTFLGFVHRQLTGSSMHQSA